MTGHPGDFLNDPDAAPPAPAPPGGPFALAWRNYIKSVFKKGFMYKVSCKPAATLYVAENKTLAGKEDRVYEGEALGRKMAIVFFEDAPGPGSLVRRVNRETTGMQQTLLSIAEVLQTLGVHIPPDPERSAAQTELFFEGKYENLEVLRFTCAVEAAALEPHTYSLGDEQHAETALASEVPGDSRTKMMLARCLQRNEDLAGDETLQTAWGLSLAALRGRAAGFLPPALAAPPAPALAPALAPAGPAAPPAPAAGRGRGGRGRAARGRGGRGRA